MAEDIYLDSIPAEFWRVVEEAHQDPARMRELLKDMGREDLKKFAWTYEALANELREGIYTQHTAPGLSEDGIFEVAHWVMAQGKDFYEKVWDDPSQMPSTKKSDPGLLRAIERTYEERFGEDVPINRNEWDYEWRENGKSSPWD